MLLDVLYLALGTAFSLGVLVVREGVRSPLKRMDYIIAGVATVLLFAHLVYALLKPERF